MLEFRCKDVGVVCRTAVKGRTKDELLEHIAEHAKEKHGVDGLSQTLVNYAVKHVRGDPEEAPASAGETR